ncbi:MAG: TIGR04086 family membrane protein [Clostridia bacterium]|nr:TIGR04086 family membrane protein [Clostridia bacterium]
MLIMIKENKKTFLLSFLLGLTGFFVFALLFAAVLYFLGLDRAYAAVFATLSISAGAFISSYYSALKIKGKGYLIGVLTGAVYFVAVSILSALLSKGFVGTNTLFHLIIIVLSAAVGGITGVNKKEKKII